MRSEEEVTKRKGAWLTSTVTWLAFFIPGLGYATGVIPLSEDVLGSISSVAWVVTIAGWLITGWLGTHSATQNLGMRSIMFILGGVVAVIAAGIVEDRLIVIIPFILITGIAVVMSGSLGGQITEDLVMWITGGLVIGIATGVALQVGDFVGVVAAIIAWPAAAVVTFFAIVIFVAGPTAGLLKANSKNSHTSKLQTFLSSKEILVVLLAMYLWLGWLYLLAR